MIGNGTTEGVRNSDNLKRFEDIVANVLEGRAGLLRQLTDPRRDIDGECGYPSGDGVGVGGLNSELYRLLYEREAVANRVVQVYPKESWQVTPLVYEDEDPAISTEFEAAWDELGQSLRGEQCWYQDEKGSPVWEHLKRADILSGIGHFGVILLAFDDGLPLDQPLETVAREEVTPEGERVVNLARPVRRSYSLYRTMGNGLVRNCGLRVVNVSTETRRYPTRPSKEVEAAPIYGSDPISGRPTVVGNRIYSIEQGDEPVGGWGTVPGGNPRYSKPTTNAYVASPGPGYVFTGPGTDAQYDGAYWGAGGINTQPGNGYNPLNGKQARDQGKKGGKGGKGGAEQGRGEGEQERQEEGQPGKEEKQPGRRLLFMRAFDESLVQIVQYESDVRNPRFGMPVMYRITLNDPRDMHGGIGLTAATVRVHWSRVIHLADNLGSSEIFGVPRMRPVLNRLLDLRKLYSGSAEMYWRGAFPGLALSTHPTLGGDVEVDKGSIRDTMENYFNGLQRYLMLMGMSAQTLSPQVVDPTSQISLQIEAICIQLGCPIRVFKGSERGELASSQDDAAWNDRLRERQNTYLTPRVIAPLIDRLIAAGVLPQPRGYSIEWPDLTSLSQTDKASLGSARAQALAAYTGVQPTGLIGKFDYLTRVIGMEDEEAAAVLQAAEAEAAQAAAAQAAAQAPVPVDPSLVQLVDDGQGNQVPVIDDGQGNQVVVQDDGAGGYTLPAQQAVQLGLAPPEILQGAGPVSPGTPPGTPPPGAPGAPPPTEPVPPGSPEEEALSDEEGDVPPPDEEDEGEDTDEGDDNPPGGGPRRTAPPGRKLPASGKPPLGNTSGPHDYASTQYNLPPRASRRVGKLAAMIEEEDLAGDGREDTPHVTVRYGLLSDEPAKALALAARLGPVHATLGEVKVFSSSANTVSDDSAAGLVTPTDSPDVVYIEVGSPLLHKLNRQLKQAYPHVEKYREYRPHVTLAYVKPGTGAKYAGPCTLTGLSFDLHDFVFSTRGGKKSYLHDGVSNVFCATGKGGGVDPACKKGKGESRQAPPSHTLAPEDNNLPGAGRQAAQRSRAVRRAVEALDRPEAQLAAHVVREAEHAAILAHRAARRQDWQTAREEHVRAAGAHARAAEILATVIPTDDRDSIPEVELNDRAAELHRWAVREIEARGKAGMGRYISESRQHASAASLRALEHTREAPHDKATPYAEEAAVASDKAFDSRTPKEAARLHRRASYLHARAAEGHGSDTASPAHLRSRDAHREAARLHADVALDLHTAARAGYTYNVFCATGEGGGIDPTCRKDSTRRARAPHHTSSVAAGDHSAEALAVSRQVDKDNRQGGPHARARRAAEDSARAVEAMSRGDLEDATTLHRRASHSHNDAAVEHGWEADRVTSSQDREGHLRAARVHRQASEAHSSAAREIYQGGRGVNSREVRREREQAAESTEEATRMLGGMKAYLRRPEASPRERELADVTEQAAVFKDEALDSVDPQEASRLHREVAHLHERGSDLAVEARNILRQSNVTQDNNRRIAELDHLGFLHREGQRHHNRAANRLHQLSLLGHVTNVFQRQPNTNVFQRQPNTNVFCATGEGGGVGPFCKKGESRQVDPSGDTRGSHAALETTRATTSAMEPLRQQLRHQDTRASRQVASVDRWTQQAERRAQAALDADTSEESTNQHELAAEAHRTASRLLTTLIDELHENHETGLLGLTRAAQEAHEEAGRSQLAAAAEARRGRGHRIAETQKLREDAHGTSQEALALSARTEAGQGRLLSQEAAVKADEAADAREINEAIRLHREATTLHYQSMRAHHGEGASSRDKFHYGTDTEEAGKDSYRQAAEAHASAAYVHRNAAEDHERAANHLESLRRTGHVSNVFCPTGAGGGVDPSCKKAGRGARRQAPPDDEQNYTTVLARRANGLVKGGPTSAKTAAKAAQEADREEGSQAYADGEAAAMGRAAASHEKAAQAHERAAKATTNPRDAAEHESLARSHRNAAYRTRERLFTGNLENARRDLVSLFPDIATHIEGARRYMSRTEAERVISLVEEAANHTYDANSTRDLKKIARGYTLAAGSLAEAARPLRALSNFNPDGTADLKALWDALQRGLDIAYSGAWASNQLHKLRQVRNEEYAEEEDEDVVVENVFCATGEGGGVDPSCKRGESRQAQPDNSLLGHVPALRLGDEAMGFAARQLHAAEGHGPTDRARGIIVEGRRAWNRVVRASESGDRGRLLMAQQELSLVYERVASALREVARHGPPNTADLYQAAHQIEEARAQVQFASDELRSGGRGQTELELQQQRDRASEASQNALRLAEQTGDPVARDRAAEAAVASDEAYDARDTSAAAALHSRASEAHGAAAVHHHELVFDAGELRRIDHRAHREAAQAHELAQQEHASAARRLAAAHRAGYALNIFCATGEGGGVDPSCRKGDIRQSEPSHPNQSLNVQGIAHEATWAARNTHRGLHHDATADELSRTAVLDSEDAQRYLKEGDVESARQAHRRAAYSHQEAFEHHDRSSRRSTLSAEDRQVHQAAARAHAKAADAHEAADTELREGGREAMATSAKRLREEAQAANLTARLLLEDSLDRRVRDATSEASVLSDKASDESEINEATAAAREAEYAHRKAAGMALDLYYETAGPGRAGADSARRERYQQLAQAHDRAAVAYSRVARYLHELRTAGHVSNVFGATGKRGGVDPATMAREEQTP